MNADEFVNNLLLCAPPLEKLLGLGFTALEAEEFRGSFHCPIKIDGESNTEPLLDLVQHYDASRVEIGILRLANKVSQTAHGWQVGAEETNPLIVSRQSGEVFVEEAGTNRHIIWACAKDGEHFLSAVIVAACFLSQCIYDFELNDNQEAKCSLADRCATEAGGGKYLRFYQMLVGCEV